jgi:hypothetical protein
MPFAIHEPPEAVKNVTLQFALLLRDGFADSDELLGVVTVTGGNISGQRKDSTGTFLFYDLKPGAQQVAVSSDPDTPYYLPAKVGIQIPVPDPPPPMPFLWPAFPDIRLADPNLLLGDAGQKAAYKTQRAAASLSPSISYPFPEGATLIRGRVTHAGGPLMGASVQQAGSADPGYVTDSEGEFVLYWRDAPATPKAVTLDLKAAGLPDKSAAVTVMRGLTVSTTVDM